jgi:heat shock protein HslJ
MKMPRLLLIIVLLISTCGPLAGQTQAPPRTERPSAGSRLANTHWRLASFGAPGGQSAVLEGTTITLKFGADGRAGGSGGCNSYGGEYREQGGSLSFSRIVSTKRACLDESANRQEQRYFAALESASRFSLADTRLTIFHGGGRSRLNFVNGSPPEPAGQRYENLSSPVALLASLEGKSGGRRMNDR